MKLNIMPINIYTMCSDNKEVVDEYANIMQEICIPYTLIIFNKFIFFAKKVNLFT